MDVGVWMSRGVLAHKRDIEHVTQTWNFRELPEGFSCSSGTYRLFIALEGYWRGFFVLRQIECNMQDKAIPWTVAFAPRSWTPVAPSRAPLRDHRLGYTLQVPILAPVGNEGTRRKNESKRRDFISLLERE